MITRGDLVGRMADVVVPGDGATWPAASAAIDLAQLEQALCDAVGAEWLDDCAARWPGPDSETALFATLEAEKPAMTERVIEAVFTAYYSAEAVRLVIDRLADSGPREPSPHFDEALLAQVRATQAGKRRY